MRTRGVCVSSFVVIVLLLIGADASSSDPQRSLLSCESVGRDVAFQDGIAVVSCPGGCHADHAATTYGVSIHPLSSAVCASAIADGVLPTAGGEIVLSRVQGIASYTSKDTGIVVAQPGTDDGEGAFHVYASSSIDQISGSVRVTDGSGALSSVGLLEVRTDRGWGSVCGMNTAAADVACRSLGYTHGAVGSSPCDFYGGSNLCGARGSPVAMKDVRCSGSELDLSECAWLSPDERCFGHRQDVILYCSFSQHPSQEGALRLLASDGSPSITGEGRIELFRAGSWTPICTSGFTPGAEVAACRQMGFVAVASVDRPSSCVVSNSCGSVPPRVSEMACIGNEASLLDCPFEEGDAVFCAPEESVIVKCIGEGGDTQGRVAKAAAPKFAPTAFPSVKLGCDSTLISTGMSVHNPGTTFIGVCGACADTSAAPLAGSFIYAPGSSICKAAMHAAVVGPEGGVAVVTVGFGQEQYFGSTLGSLESQLSGKERRSFTVARPIADVYRRFAGGALMSASAGASPFGVGKLASGGRVESFNN